MPRDERVGIVASDFLVRNPHLLRKFSPDELTLIDLNASKTYMPSFLAQIGYFPQLKFLNLYDAEFHPSDYPMLAKLKELRYLNLAWNEVDCDELLKYLPKENLQSLDVSGTEKWQCTIAQYPFISEVATVESFPL